MKRILNIGLALVVAILSSCEKDYNSVPEGYISGEKKKPEGAYVSNANFKIVAYYSEAREIDSIAEIKYKQITHLHYAFAYPTADGGIKAIAKPANFARIKELRKQHGFKLAITIAAVSAEDGKVFAKLVTDHSLRKIFIKNIINFAVLNDLDGVDIDWEYPNFNSAQNITYEAFMKELSAELHSWHKYLSAAVTAGVYAGGVRDGVTLEAVEAMDFVNLMAYDGAGWKGDNNHSSLMLAQDVLDYWLNEKGIPKEKAVLGMPAYGKTIKVGTVAVKSKIYRDILLDGGSSQSNIFTIDDDTYYYNGIPLIKQKAQLAKDQANGIMFWELYQDANGENSLIKAANDQLGRIY